MAEPAVTQAADGAPDQSLGDLVSQAVGDVSQLIKYELDLARLEIKADIRRIGIAGVLVGFAGIVGAMTLVMLCWAYGYGLIALGIWAWAAFLIVAGTLVLLGALAVLVGVLLVRRMSGLRRTVRTVQDDLSMLQREADKAAQAAAPGASSPR
jgi:uncharacterized membrane protein YqjE